MESAEKGSDEFIDFELLGEKFRVKADVSKEYFMRLVELLNEKIKNMKAKYPSMSSIKLLIFSALDFADELYQQGKRSVEKEAIEKISFISESLASALEE